MDDLTEVQVQDLQEGDVLVLGEIRRTVKHRKPSGIDPVDLITFEETGETIAKSPDDYVWIDEQAAA